MAYIYCITNKMNGKRYIGETINIDQRWKQHLYHLEHNEHHSSKLQQAYIEYGKDNFEFSILKEVPLENRFEEEIKYIKLYDSFYNGYNETTGGDNPGYEILQKVVYCYDYEGNYLDKYFNSGRDASRKLGIDQGLLQKICKGYKNSAYGRDGFRYRFSYELVNKLPKIKEFNHNAKEIYQYSIDGVLVGIFNSGADVNRYYCISPRCSKIYNAIKNESLYKGYYWKYKE